MCFSTTASFAAGTLLTTISAACLSKTQGRSELMFATIPLIFGMQQFSEGFVWLSLTTTSDKISPQISANSFLIFALVIWPAWVPLSMVFIERNKLRRKILEVISVMGILFSLASLYFLSMYPSRAQIAYYHIHYDLNISHNLLLAAGTLYLIPTVASHFVSSVKRVPFMGFLVLASHIISRIFFKENLLSVWCFFAALISITIYFILKRKSPELASRKLYNSIQPLSGRL